jgi:hypothetical protein
VIGQHQHPAVHGLVRVVVLVQVEPAGLVHPQLAAAAPHHLPGQPEVVDVRVRHDQPGDPFQPASGHLQCLGQRPARVGLGLRDRRFRAGGDAAVHQHVAVVAVQQVGAHRGHAVDAQRQRHPVHAGHHLRHVQRGRRVRHQFLMWETARSSSAVVWPKPKNSR